MSSHTIPLLGYALTAAALAPPPMRYRSVRRGHRAAPAYGRSRTPPFGTRKPDPRLPRGARVLRSRFTGSAWWFVTDEDRVWRDLRGNEVGADRVQRLRIVHRSVRPWSKRIAGRGLRGGA